MNFRFPHFFACSENSTAVFSVSLVNLWQPWYLNVPKKLSILPTSLPSLSPPAIHKPLTPHPSRTLVALWVRMRDRKWPGDDVTTPVPGCRFTKTPPDCSHDQFIVYVWHWPPYCSTSGSHVTRSISMLIPETLHKADVSWTFLAVLY